MTRYATAVVLLCLSSAYATPSSTPVEAPAAQSDIDKAGPRRSGAEAPTVAPDGPPPDKRERALMEALRTLALEESEFERPPASFAFDDLNQDRVDEAVVHLTSPSFCGTGGCTTLVYQWDSQAAAYVEIDRSPATRPPIYASSREGCQWSMLWLQRSGGGRATELHSPAPLTELDSCDVPVGTWNEAKSRLLIPVHTSRAEGASP